MPDAITPTTPILPTTGPVICPAPVTTPGFDGYNKPLDDAHVWPKIKYKPPVTADGINRGELEKLIQLGAEKPKEFFQRLLADSMNGTPVNYQHTHKAGRFGEIEISIKVNEGDLKMSATFRPYKKVVRKSGVADFFVDKQLRGQKPGVTIETKGKINMDGSISGMKLAVKAVNLPKLSMDAISGKNEAMADLKEVLKIEGKRRRGEEAKWLMEDIFSDPERFLPMILAEVADDSDKTRFTITPSRTAMRIRAMLGGGSFKVNVSHILGKDPDEDIDVKATVKGTVEDWGDSVQVDELKLATTQDLTLVMPSSGDMEDAKVLADGKELPRSRVEGLAMMAFFAMSALAEKID